jgi:GDP-L-fucose synthase
MDLTSKRIVVTGGAGFLGSFVVEALHARGVRAVVVPRRREYNLTDRAACARLVRDHRPDVVFHLAARVGGIGANRDNPGLFLFDNAIMGLQLIEECRLGGVAKVIVAGTICAYPKHAPVPFREDDLWNGYPEETNAPYGMAKRLLLAQAQAYREQYGMNTVVLFPVNLYGPRDNFDARTSHVIPAIILKCLAAREQGAGEVRLWGDGTPTREFLYVEDAAEAFVLAAERYDSSEPVNVGTGAEIAIRDLAHQIAAAVGFRGELVWDPSQPNGQPRRQLEVTRARERFGFVARVALTDGLERTIAWARAARREGRL